jgi:2-iminobutanoate/2-iminopropanoate deaminase
MTFPKREIVHTDKAPGAVGPYSQAVKTDTLVFTAGQIALNPATGKFSEGGIKAQTRQVLLNLQAVLEASGAGLETVLKTTVFLKHMSDFQAMNEVYAEFFTAEPPARSAVQAAALPLNALVEIEAVALLK